MEKLSINKLLANDIVNYGMDKTMSFNYVVSLDDFLNDYDDYTKEYVKSNLNGIKESIQNHEAVADVEFNDSRNEIDMVFYMDNLLNSMELNIYGVIDNEGLDDDINLDEVRQISFNIKSSDKYNDLIKENIYNFYKKNDKELV